MDRKSRLLSVLMCITLMVILILATSSMAAQKKVKLVYWTMWEPNPIFTAYLEEAGKEFAKKNPLCEGVEALKIPFAGFEAKYLAAFMARKGAPDMFIGNAFEWAGTYDFADKMPDISSADIAFSELANINAFGLFGHNVGKRDRAHKIAKKAC